MRRFLLAVIFIAFTFLFALPAFAQSNQNTVITPGTVSGTIIACVGTASASPNIQQFTVSGSNLTAPVIANAPIGFEISLTPGSGYGNSVTINQTAGSISNTTIYVRSAANAPDGPLSGTVTLISTGAANQSVVVSGIVNTLPTVNTVQNQTVISGTPVTATSFTGTGSTFNWTNDAPGIGLAASGTGDIPSFTAINSSTQPVIAHVTVTPFPSGFAYITNLNDNTVSVINTTTNKIVKTISVGDQPIGITVTKDGQTIYVTNVGDNSISVISATTNTVTSTINNVGQGPYEVILSPDQTKLYVSNSDVNTISVINIATGTVINTFTLGANPDGIRLSPDGTLLYAASALTSDVYVFNTATNALIATIPVGTIPSDLVLSPDGNTAYVISAGSTDISIINTLTYTVIKTIHVGTNLQAICISPDGSKIYISDIGNNGILVYSTATYNLLTTINLLSSTPPGDQPEGISLSPDGSRLYVANQYSNTVSVINTANNSIINSFAAGKAPSSIGNFVTAGTGCTGIPTTFTITVTPASLPTIIAGRVTGDIIVCDGSPVDPRQFTISGTGLTADIIATAPEYFELSLSPTSGYSSTLTIPETNGTVPNTVIYVRIIASAPVWQDYQDANLDSKGAVTQQVIISYTKYAIPIADAVQSQTVINGSSTSPVTFNGTAGSYNWVNNTPGIGLAASGTGNIPAFTAINNTAAPITATITATPLNGADCSGTPVIFTITVNPTPIPSTLTATANLNPLTTVYGTPSSAESFTVSGANITSGISVTPPGGFEVSSNGSTFTTTTTISGSGTVSNAPVYIRLAAITPVGSYNGNIVLSTANTSSINVIMPASTVTPAPLTITADNQTKPFGAINPPLTVTYTGFVNNEGPSQLTLQPIITTTAQTQSPIGQYPITADNAASPNYNITYVPGILTVEPAISKIDIPNTFTPNGDRINDTWEIKYLEYYPKSTVNVFDRWGQKVFSSIGYPIPWDGTYKGSILPSGTYYYIIDPKTGQGVFSGWLAIIK